MNAPSRIPPYGGTVLALDPGKATGYALCTLHKADPNAEADTADWGVGHYILGDKTIRVVESGAASFEEIPEILDSMVRVGLAHHRILTEAAGRLTLDKHTGDEILDRPLFIVAEHFTLTANSVKGQSLWSSEIIGMARYIAARSGGLIVLDDSQQPSSMKNLIHRNNVLRETGLARNGMTPHEKDALGHAFLFATRLGGKK